MALAGAVGHPPLFSWTTHQRASINTMTFTKITNTPNNELVRIGFGRHAGTWFIRLDLWRVGVRVTF